MKVGKRAILNPATNEMRGGINITVNQLKIKIRIQNKKTGKHKLAPLPKMCHERFKQAN